MSKHQGMSADEIAVLEELDETGTPKPEEHEIVDAGGEGDDGEGDTADVTPAKPTPAKAAAEEGDGEDPEDDPAPVVAAPAADPAPVVEPEPKAEAPAAREAFVPQYTAEAPADAEAQLKTLKGEERDAFRKLMDGEIDQEAYDAIRDRTDTATDSIKAQVLKAQIFTEANEQAAQQQARAEWERTQTASMTAFKTEGLDYLAKPALLAAFNVNMKALAADTANEDKDAAWFFKEAHKRTKDDLGIVLKPAAASAPAAPAKPSREVDRNLLPPTLRSAPAAADPTVAGNEFAHLNGLSGFKLESALSKLTPEQMERYLD